MKSKLILLLAALFALALSSCCDMTEEELAEQYVEQIYSYDILSVSQYVKPLTSYTGIVIGSEVCFTFTYIDENGKLCIVDDFSNANVCLGETDQYAVVHRELHGRWQLPSYQYLYLTEETLQTMGVPGVNDNA